jgi:hypothetical protein
MEHIWMKHMNVQLSPSSLSVLLECPRCFWLLMKKSIKRPSGPFPSLPGGMDGLIKKYFDSHRARGSMPPELQGAVNAELFPDQATLDVWRDWRQGLKVVISENGHILRGAIDECFVHDGLFIPVDYKTRGYDLKDETSGLYQHQLDIYALLLSENGYPSAGYGYLIFYIPVRIEENGIARFKIDVVRMETDTQRARNLVTHALDVLNGPLPPQNESCAFCAWAKTIGSL